MRPLLRVAAHAVRGAGRPRRALHAARAALVPAVRRPPRRALSDVSMTFVDSDGERFPVAGAEGKTVLDVALDHDIDIEAACGGELACSTCHVILEQGLYDALEEPDEEETDMLDLAWGLEDTSRLCCQIKVTKELEGAVFVLPEDPDF
mmetsp:Transcript_27099/g.81268  ORF Transcript_27099/g.81268 Transcript_27099/m.81268 type:complete len:149 (+) Transcript_27099:128-574(+)